MKTRAVRTQSQASKPGQPPERRGNPATHLGTGPKAAPGDPWADHGACTPPASSSARLLRCGTRRAPLQGREAGQEPAARGTRVPQPPSPASPLRHDQRRTRIVRMLGSH